MSRPNAQSMKPATAAKKLDVYLPATPAEFQQTPITRAELQQETARLQQRLRKTILLVTHDVEEALLLGDQVVFLSRHPGRVRAILHPPFKADAAIGTREALRAHPAYGAMEREILQMMRDEGQA